MQEIHVCCLYSILNTMTAETIHNIYMIQHNRYLWSAYYMSGSVLGKLWRGGKGKEDKEIRDITQKLAEVPLPLSKICVNLV